MCLPLTLNVLQPLKDSDKDSDKDVPSLSVGPLQGRTSRRVGVSGGQSLPGWGHVPLKRLCWSTWRSPQSVTAANARQGLSQPGQRVASSFSPEPGAGRGWAGCTPCGLQTAEGHLGSRTLATGAPVATDGHRRPQVQGWARTATQDHRLSGLGTSSEGAWAVRFPGSGADGEPRECLPRRLEATVTSRSRCRAWLPTREEDALACSQTHCPRADCPGCQGCEQCRLARDAGSGGAGRAPRASQQTRLPRGRDHGLLSVSRRSAGSEHTVDGRMDGRTRSCAARPDLASLRRSGPQGWPPSAR